MALNDRRGLSAIGASGLRTGKLMPLGGISHIAIISKGAKWLGPQELEVLG
ncbi:hypothetical protein ACIPVK_13855 [Paeniglutamicibacter sp. MACA_103]|uniref:hypothetical protein n=1 Tax=Paeniglutamicibacter sp. MACA_103 TaxID=3377337 RepID=UPI0038955E3A